MLTDKEKMELLNLRKRVAAQKAEITRLLMVIQVLKEGNNAQQFSHYGAVDTRPGT